MTAIRRMRGSVLLPCLLMLACNEVALKEVAGEGQPQEICQRVDDSETGPDSLGLRAFNGCGFAISRSNRVDVLFVVDQSPRGQAWQLQLADSMLRFVEALAEAEPAPDVQIGIVGAQGQGDACLDGPSVGGSRGVFSSRSCLERPEDFSSPEVFERACASRCESSESPEAQWFTFAGESTLDPVALGEQLRCAAVLGDRGCPLAQPFGSAYSVLQRRREDGLFFRDEAVPMVVVVSGSDDCTPQAVGDFGNDVTPAQCWTAGSRCVEAGPSVWRCEPETGGDTGLVPVAEAFGWVEARAMWGRLLGLRRGHLALWMGWLPGSVGAGPVHARPPGAEDGERSGVAPSCTDGESVAMPPVRAAGLWAHAEGASFAVTGRSLCGGGLGSAMTELGERVAATVSAGCVPACVADEDEAAAGLQPECDFVVAWREGDVNEERFVHTCEDDAGSGLVVPDGDPGCVELRSGAALHPRCEEQGNNLSVTLHWEGREPPGVQLVSSCSLSRDKATDCYGLPG
ncbi:MAG: hypothetical protein KUG77_11810 [Nannocystaceae bacterium]|nr:hypothetical protein [Nannocystaceae bacterium]